MADTGARNPNILFDPQPYLTLRELVLWLTMVPESRLDALTTGPSANRRGPVDEALGGLQGLHLVGGGHEVKLALDQLGREGARRMIEAALNVEADDYVERFADRRDAEGKRLVVRNGRRRERTISIGADAVVLRVPRVNDRRFDEVTRERKRFRSRILPAYARPSPEMSAALPLIYLTCLSIGNFGLASHYLLGADAAELSLDAMGRLNEMWLEEYRSLRRRDLRSRRHARWLAVGVDFGAAWDEPGGLSMLVVIGVTEGQAKELLAVTMVAKSPESVMAWARLIGDLKSRGAPEPPALIAEPPLGAGAALRHAYRAT